MRRAELAGGAAYVAGILLIAHFADEFWLFLLTSALITALVAVSVGVIYDNAGLLSLCQMTFAGVGAWTVGWLSHRTGLPYLAQLPIAALVALVVGAIVGIPALRLRGLNLAVFTLVFSAAVSRVIFADGFPGLLEGNRVTPPGFARSDAGFFRLVAVVLGLVGVAVGVLRRARMGRWWCSVRRSERAVAALGRVRATAGTAAEASAVAVRRPEARVAGAGPAVLEAADVSVSYGAVRALDGVSFAVAGGSILGLIGPNGAGKSTMVDAIAGFISRHEGTVTLAGGEVEAS